MRRLVIGLVVVVGLLIAADFGAAAIAESAVSRQMREQIGLADDPSVTINGFPFLTQAIAGEYGDVDVHAERITVGDLTDLAITAKLSQVEVPLSTLLGSGPKTVTVKQARGTVRISANDLEKQLPGVTKLRVESLDENALDQAAQDAGDVSIARLDPGSSVRLVGTLSALGLEREVSVIATLQLENGAAEIVPHSFELGDDQTVPTAVERTLRELFTVRVNPGSLPLQVMPTALRARDGALEVSGTAQDLVLGSSATTTAGR